MKPILTLTLNPCIDASSDADTIQPIHKIRTSKESFQAGGGGINAARVINTLGGRSLAVYLSGGTTGGVLNDLVKACEISSRHVTIAGDTRISHTVYERSSGLEFRFVPQGPSVTETEWRECLRAVGEADFDYVIASGSLPQGMPDDFYVMIGAIAKAKGARLVLDTSGAPLKATLVKGGVYLTKPSPGEFRDYVGRDLPDDASLMEAAVEVVRSGKTEILVVSMGHEGAVMATSEGAIRMTPPAVEAVSAVGAGDSFVGAMTFALSRGLMP
jgi:6-phosphofructokinase 2